MINLSGNIALGTVGTVEATNLAPARFALEEPQRVIVPLDPLAEK